MDEHNHQWQVADVDDTAGGAAARMVTFTCTGCDEQLKRLTAKTDAEIAAELANG